MLLVYVAAYRSVCHAEATFSGAIDQMARKYVAILCYSGPFFFFPLLQSPVVLFSHCTQSLSLFLFAPYCVLLITV